MTISEGKPFRKHKRHSVELLVVGAHGHKGFSDWLYGSTIDELRHRLNISVLVAGREG